MREIAAKINIALAWVLFAGANLAIVLIALSVFGAASREVHRMSGAMLGLITLLLVISALAARANRLNVGVSLLVFVLFFFQPFFAYSEFSIPALHALHAVNGLAIMYLGYMLANGRARATFEAPEAALTQATTGD